MLRILSCVYWTSVCHLPTHFLIRCCSVAKLFPTLCDPMDCSVPGFPVLHHLPQFAQIPVHWVDDAIQPAHCLPPSQPAFSLSHYQGLFQWVSASHLVAKVLELQRQSFQWIFMGWFPWGLSGLILQSKGLSSSAPQLENISSSALSFLYGPTLVTFSYILLT